MIIRGIENNNRLRMAILYLMAQKEVLDLIFMQMGIALKSKTIM